MRHHLKVLSCFPVLAWALLTLVGSGIQSRGQATGFGASVSPASTVTNGAITYTLSLTNLVPGFDQTVFITNSFSAGVNLVSVTNNYSSAGATNTGSHLVLVVPDLSIAAPSVFTVTVTTTNTGPLTNFLNFVVLNPLTLFNTNVVVSVTNTPPAQADLAVLVTGPETDVYSGDWVTFGVVVTNLGANNVTGVSLSNRFNPPIRSINPTNQFVNGAAVLSIGTLTNHSSRAFTFTVQPTNLGNLSFAATVRSSAADTDPANDTSETNVIVSALLTNQLVTTVLSPTQTFNFINGLMEQRIAVSNASPEAISAARVRIDALTATNRLVNAVGTNDGRPFVVHAAPLGPQETVALTLQFKVPSRQPFVLDPANLLAQGMNAVDLTPPPWLTATNAVGRITNVLGHMVIEFPSVQGRSYTIVYSDDALFTDPKVVRPSVVAPANWTFWIDHGPPATATDPMDAPSRFYKVYRNP